jgi:hypothetical protein
MNIKNEFIKEISNGPNPKTFTKVIVPNVKTSWYIILLVSEGGQHNWNNKARIKIEVTIIGRNI